MIRIRRIEARVSLENLVLAKTGVEVLDGRMKRIAGLDELRNCSGDWAVMSICLASRTAAA